MEKIEVGYRNIGSIGGVEYYHKFLLYTDSNGNQYTISGWTGNDVSSTSPFGHMNIEIDLPYNQTNFDHPDNPNAQYYDQYGNPIGPQKQYREPITEGEDLSNLWNNMLQNALSKDDIYPYDPLLQNSNTFADSVLKDANLSAPNDDNFYDPTDHWAPASGKELTQNLIPANPEELGVSDVLKRILDGWFDELSNDAKNISTDMYEDIKSKMDMLKDYLNNNGDTPAPDDLTYDPNKLTPITPDSDIDRDGIPDLLDPDMDGDGLPDNQDSDMDNDGIPNDIDPDPLTPNPNPKDGHPFAPLPPLQRRDPLVLDMNKDGLISTVSLADSTAFFDLTGDGIKEKVGWVQASEGIVAFDKNGNGKIDGISEVFGTATTSGFAELRTLADSNYDNVIDRRDELYNQLKVWQDTNQDGISQASELKTLSQAGVNNIELNVFATNINLNGNLLTEAGRYGDSTGIRSLAADVELTFDSRITTVDTSLIPDYTVHADAASLPKLRGYGVVYNSEIAYNVNDNLRNLAITMSTDITQLSNNNYLKQNIFTYISKSDTINNCFYILNLNKRKAA